MEEQDSIVLQKKSILLLSVIITLIITSIAYIKNESKIVVVAQDTLKISSAEQYFKNLIKVENLEETNNDIISIEQVSYAAKKQVIETAPENKEISKNTQETEEIVIQTEKDETITQTNSDEKDVQEENNENIKQDNNEIESTNVDEPQQVSQDFLNNGVPTEYSNVIEARATAYCLCKKCCGKSPSDSNYGMTASGYRIVPGTGAKVVAVDPKLVPLGSNVYVEGLNGAWDYGYAIAADTGGSIKNLRVDLYMDTHEEALRWGSKQVKLYVID